MKAINKLLEVAFYIVTACSIAALLSIALTSCNGSGQPEDMPQIDTVEPQITGGAMYRLITPAGGGGVGGVTLIETAVQSRKIRELEQRVRQLEERSINRNPGLSIEVDTSVFFSGVRQRLEQRDTQMMLLPYPKRFPIFYKDTTIYNPDSSILYKEWHRRN